MNRLEMRARDIGFSAKQLIRYIRIRDFRRRLKERAEADLAASETAKERILFCGVPVHKNMGDQAQRYCIRKWCGENYPDRKIVELPSWPFYDRSFQAFLRRRVREDDIFVIQSGYCTTSRHYEHRMHRFVVKNFPDNRILIMPQTISFRYEKDGFNTGRIYDGHKKLLFLARDSISFGYAKKFFPGTRSLLYPDIVTTLIGTRSYGEKRDGIYLCVRSDPERKYSDEEIEGLQKALEDRQIPCEKGDTESPLSLPELVKGFEKELDRILKYFASFRVVVTDRYHGTIFSLIAGTPVVVLATNDHKVVTGTDWFKEDLPGSFALASSPEEAQKLALKFLEEGAPAADRPLFKDRYYDHLKESFDALI